MTTGFQFERLVWLQLERPQAYAQLQHCLLPKIIRTASELVTNPSDAPARDYLNGASGQWDTDILIAHEYQPSFVPLWLSLARSLAG